MLLHLPLLIMEVPEAMCLIVQTCFQKFSPRGVLKRNLAKRSELLNEHFPASNATWGVSSFSYGRGRVFS